MAKTKWSIQDVKNLFNELDKITGADSSKVEIKINGRLKRALARYTCYTYSRVPVKFDFSTDIMNVPSFQALKDTAIHEYAHFYCNSVLKVEEKEMGHGKKFKEACKLLGTNNDQPTCTRFISNQVKAVRYGIDLGLLNEVFEEEPKQEIKEPEVQPTVEEQPKTKKGRTIGRFDLNGNLLEKGNFSHFKEQGYPMGNVSKCCNGKLKTCKGYVWKYLD